MWEKCRCILSLQNSSLWRHSGWKRTDKIIVLGLISSIPSLPFSPGVLLLQASGFFWIERETIIKQQNLGDDFTSHASDHTQCHPFRVSQRSQCRKPVKEGEEKRNSCKEICEFAELQEDKGRFGTQCWEAKWYFLSWVGVSPWKQIKTFSSLVPKMKLPKKVKCREKMVKATKPALPVKIGGYDIMDVDNCDVLSFKMRLKCSESRDQGCVTSYPGYTDAFSHCAEDPRELVTLLCTAAWLQRGELVLAAKWVHKLNMRLEPVSPTFGVYTVAGVTCEKSRVFITICSMR